MYIFREGDAFCIIGTHVDDLFPLCNSHGERIRERILACLKERMEIENKGEIKYALDTHIERDREGHTQNITTDIYRKYN